MRDFNFLLLSVLILVLSGCAGMIPYDRQVRVGDREDLGEVLYDGLPEISGIAASRLNPDIFWVHNDSGDQNRIYAINRRAQHVATVSIPSCVAWDWEDIAIGPGPKPDVPYVYVANTGDNLQLRKEVQVCRFPEPIIATGGMLEAEDVEVLRLRYPDGPHDSEALFIDPVHGDLYLITKRDPESIVFRLPASGNAGAIGTLEQVASLPVTGICAADISRDGREIIAKTLSQVLLWRVLGDESRATVFQRPPYQLPYVREPQGEAIAWGAQMEGYYTVSESVFGLSPHLYYYPRH